MTTEELVQELAQQGQPIKRLHHPLRRFLLWAAVSMIAVVLGLTMLGIRSDLTAVWSQSLQIVLAIGLAASSVSSVLLLSVPSRWSRSVYLVPVGFLTAWTALNIYASITAGHHGIGSGLNCVRNILVLSVLPGFLLYAALRATAPLRSGYVVFLATLGISTLSCLATRFVCPQDGAVHFLVWHYMPVLLLSAASALGGHLILLRSEGR
jgi:hypothetical protein